MLESAMREVRNRIAAHIDSQSPLSANLDLFENSILDKFISTHVT